MPEFTYQCRTCLMEWSEVERLIPSDEFCPYCFQDEIHCIAVKEDEAEKEG